MRGPRRRRPERLPELWAGIAARIFTRTVLAAAHRLAVDCYCLQHPETYWSSAKSYAAHLMGLGRGTELDGAAAGYDVIHRWLNGRTDLIRSMSPDLPGTIAIVEVHPHSFAPDARRQVHQWAAATWAAYAGQGVQADAGLAQALATGKRCPQIPGRR